MPKTDILKLIFHHDQRLDNISPSTDSLDENPLAMFTKPDPTYSTLYFSGTDLEKSTFGLNQLSNFDEVLKVMEQAFEGLAVSSKKGGGFTLSDAINDMDVDDALVLNKEGAEPELIHSFSHKMLRDVLEKGWVILYKRAAEHGFDIHLFSRDNIYTSFFYPLQELLPEAFRFFSINGKRLSNEKQFYFETWKLERPPHGFEEVFPESVL